MTPERREIIKNALQVSVMIGFLSQLSQKQALASPGRLSWEKWISDLRNTAEGLLAGRLSPGGWQKRMDELYGEAPMRALARYINVDKLVKNTEIGERGEKFLFAPLSGQFPDKEVRREVITKVAIVQKGRAIPPHTHENMVSAFLTMYGRFRVMQFEKYKTTSSHLFVKQSYDKIQRPGEWSSVSDDLVNGHSLQAIGGDALLFSTKVVEVKKDVKVRGRVYFDPEEAEHLGDGLYKAPIIDSKKAFSKT